MEKLLELDLALFRFGNEGLVNPIFDFIMPLITVEKHLLPLYFLALAILMWKGGRTGRIVGVSLIITAIVSDQVSSNFLKSLVGRLRPCHELIDLRLLINCGGGKSFPSSHAVNNFAAAMVLSWHFRKYAWIFFSFAAVIAFTRVYCGVHYPLDITAGAIIGTGIGYVMMLLKEQIAKRYEFARIKQT